MELLALNGDKHTESNMAKYEGGEKEEEEDWSDIMTTDLSAGSFAQHEVQEIRLPDGKHISIASTSTLSPLDMMDLSWGTHDATGHRIWMGAQLLIQALPALRNPFFSKQLPHRCIELGSGTGIAGIAMAKYFGPTTISKFVLTDNSQSALALCKLNCQRNDVGFQNMHVQRLEWGNAMKCDEEGEGALSNGFDIVLATDVIYDIGAWLPLLETANSCLTAGGHLIVAHVPRAALPTPDMKSTTNIPLPYHISLETYLNDVAKEQSFVLVSTVRPSNMKPFRGTEDFEQAGASILVYSKANITAAQTDQCAI